MKKLLMALITLFALSQSIFADNVKISFKLEQILTMEYIGQNEFQAIHQQSNETVGAKGYIRGYGNINESESKVRIEENPEISVVILSKTRIRLHTANGNSFKLKATIKKQGNLIKSIHVGRSQMNKMIKQTEGLAELKSLNINIDGGRITSRIRSSAFSCNRKNNNSNLMCHWTISATIGANTQVHRHNNDD